MVDRKETCALTQQLIETLFVLDMVRLAIACQKPLHPRSIACVTVKS